MFDTLIKSNSIHHLEFLDYFCPNESYNFYHLLEKFALLYDGSHLIYETSVDLSNILKNNFNILIKN